METKSSGSRANGGGVRRRARTYLSHPHREGKEYRRYMDELSGMLQQLVDTPSEDWQLQSGILSQMIRCVQANADVVGANCFPDPQLLCRALWHALNPQHVIGIQRKAVEFLAVYTRLADKDPAESGPQDGSEKSGRPSTQLDLSTVTRRRQGPPPLSSSYASSGYLSPLQHDYPFLLIGVLQLLPLSSIQLKPELLAYVEQVVQCLSPQALQTGLSGLLGATLHGLEESEGSSVFKQSMHLLKLIRTSVSALDGERVAAQRAAALRHREAVEEAAAASRAAATTANPPPTAREASVTTEEDEDVDSLDEASVFAEVSRRRQRQFPSTAPAATTRTVSQPQASAKATEHTPFSDNNCPLGRLTGGESFFATLWSLLRDCPELRMPALLLLRSVLSEDIEALVGRHHAAHASQTPLPLSEEAAPELSVAPEEGEGGAAQRERDEPLDTSLAFDTTAEKLVEAVAYRQQQWFGGRGLCDGASVVAAPRRHGLVHTALFACLQDKRDRVLRLVLDVLIQFFPMISVCQSEAVKAAEMGRQPLPESADVLALADAMVVADGSRVILSPAFTFDETSLLVTAGVQLLGLPNTSVNVVRRVVSWLGGLRGPGDGADNVGCYRVVQGFTESFHCWEATHAATVRHEFGFTRGNVREASSGAPTEAGTSFYGAALHATALHAVTADAVERLKQKRITDRAMSADGTGGDQGTAGAPLCVAGHLFIPAFAEDSGQPSLAKSLSTPSQASPAATRGTPLLADWQLPLYVWLRALTRLLQYTGCAARPQEEPGEARDGLAGARSPVPPFVGVLQAEQNRVAEGANAIAAEDPLASRLPQLLLPVLCEWAERHAELHASVNGISSSAPLPVSLTSLAGMSRACTSIDDALQGLMRVMPWSFVSAHKASLLAATHAVAARLRHMTGEAPCEAGTPESQNSTPMAGTADRPQDWQIVREQVTRECTLLYRITEVIEIPHMLNAPTSAGGEYNKNNDKAGTAAEYPARLAVLFHATWELVLQLAEMASFAAQALQNCERQLMHVSPSAEAAAMDVASLRSRRAVALVLLSSAVQLLKQQFFNVLSLIHERLSDFTAQESARGHAAAAASSGVLSSSSSSPHAAMTDAALADLIESQGFLYLLITTVDVLTTHMKHIAFEKNAQAGVANSPLEDLSAEWQPLFLECCDLVVEVVSAVGQLRWRERERMQQNSSHHRRMGEGEGQPGPSDVTEGRATGGAKCEESAAHTDAAVVSTTPFREPPSPRAVARREQTREALAVWWRDLALTASAAGCPSAVMVFVVKRVLAVARSRAMPESMRGILASGGPHFGLASSAKGTPTSGETIDGDAAQGGSAQGKKGDAKDGMEEALDCGEVMLRRLWDALTQCSSRHAKELVPLMEQLTRTMGDRGKPLLDSLMMEQSLANIQRTTTFFHALLSLPGSSSAEASFLPLFSSRLGSPTTQRRARASRTVMPPGAMVLSSYLTGYYMLLQVLIRGPHGGTVEQREAYAVAVTFFHHRPAEELVLPLLYAFAEDALLLDRTQDGLRPDVANAQRLCALVPDSPESPGAPSSVKPLYVSLEAVDLTNAVQAMLQLPDARVWVCACAEYTVRKDSALVSGLSAITRAAHQRESQAEKDVVKPCLLSLLAELLLSTAHQVLEKLQLTGSHQSHDDTASHEARQSTQTFHGAVTMVTSVYSCLNGMLSLSAQSATPSAGAFQLWGKSASHTVYMLKLVVDNMDTSASPACLQALRHMLSHVKACAAFMNDVDMVEGEVVRGGGEAYEQKNASHGQAATAPSSTSALRLLSRSRHPQPLERLFTHSIGTEGLADWVVLHGTVEVGSGDALRGDKDAFIATDNGSGAAGPSVVPSTLTTQLARSAPVALTLRALYQVLADGLHKAAGSEATLVAWGEFMLDVLPFMNKELPAGTHHMMRALVRLLDAVHVRSSLPAKEEKRSKVRAICYQILHNMIRYLCAVAAALEAESNESTKTQSTGWFSSSTKPKELGPDGRRMPLWNRSPVLLSARNWLPALVHHAMVTLSTEGATASSDMNSRTVSSAAGLVLSVTGGMRTDAVAHDDSANAPDIPAVWRFLRLLHQEAGDAFLHEFVMQWGSFFAISEQLLRAQHPASLTRGAALAQSTLATRAGALSTISPEEKKSVSLILAAEQAALLLLFDGDVEEPKSLLALILKLALVLRSLPASKTRTSETDSPAAAPSQRVRGAPTDAEPLTTSAPPTHETSAHAGVAGIPSAAVEMDAEGRVVVNPLVEPSLTRTDVRTPLTTDALYAYFIDLLLSGYARRKKPPSSASADLAKPPFSSAVVRAAFDFVTQRYTTATPTYLVIAICLHILHVVRSGAVVANSEDSALPEARGPTGSRGQKGTGSASPSPAVKRKIARDQDIAASQSFFSDLTATFVLERTFEYLSSSPLIGSPDLANHLFAYSVLSELLPLVVPPLAAFDVGSHKLNQQRISDTVIQFFTRAVLPTIKSGVQSVSEADVVARAPLVVAALRMSGALAALAEPLMRRLREDLMDTFVSGVNANGVESFFHYPSTVLAEWSRLWSQFAWAPADGGAGGAVAVNRGFIALGFEKLKVSARAGGVFASLIKSDAKDAQERAHMLSCLAFHTLALPAAATSDREYVHFVRDQIATVLKLFGSPAVSHITFSMLASGKVQLLPVRAALRLFRVLLQKDLPPLQLATFWPLIVPELVRALRIHVEPRDTEDLSVEERRKEKRLTANALDEANLAEVRALQLEALKVVDAVIAGYPDQFTSFRWVFLDEHDCCPQGLTAPPSRSSGSAADAARQRARRKQGTAEMTLFSPFITDLLSSLAPPAVPKATGPGVATHNVEERAQQRRTMELRTLLRDVPARRMVAEADHNAVAVSCLPPLLAETAASPAHIGGFATAKVVQAAVKEVGWTVEPLMMAARRTPLPRATSSSSSSSSPTFSAASSPVLMDTDPLCDSGVSIGCTRLLLSVPTTQYRRLAGVRLALTAMEAHYSLGGTSGGGGAYGSVATAAPSTVVAVAEARERGNDLWDRAYASRVLLCDMSSVDPETRF